MKRRRFFIFSGLLALGLCAAIWIFWFPYSPGSVYRVIPNHAAFVSCHDDLAGRWRLLLDNPVVETGLRFAGVADERRFFESEPGIDELLQLVAGKRTVIAFVPSLGGQPAWILASWMGGYTQFLRWLPRARGVDGMRFEREMIEGGHSIWRIEKRGDGSRGFLSAAAVDGVFVVCLSRDPNAVRHLVHYSEIQPGKGNDFWLDMIGDGEAEDSGWVAPRLTGAASAGIGGISYSTPVISEDSLVAEAEVFSMYAGALKSLQGSRLTLKHRAQFEEVSEMLGASPSALMICPWAIPRAVIGMLAEEETPAMEIIRRYAGEDGLFFLAFMSDEYGGEANDFSVPAVTAGIYIDDCPGVIEEIDDVIDVLNAQYGMALLPRRIELAGTNAVVLDNTKPGLYGNLQHDEKPVMLQINKWLLFSSSSASLSAVLNKTGAADAAGPFLTSKELSGKKVFAEEHKAFAGKINIAGTLSGLRDGFATAYLHLTNTDSEKADEARHLLAKAQYIGALTERLESAIFHVSPQADSFKVGLEVKGKKRDRKDLVAYGSDPFCQTCCSARD